MKQSPGDVQESAQVVSRRVSVPLVLGFYLHGSLQIYVWFPSAISLYKTPSWLSTNIKKLLCLKVEVRESE